MAQTLFETIWGCGANKICLVSYFNDAAASADAG